MIKHINRYLSISLFAFIGIIISSCISDSKKETRRPNIVLIVADDLGFGDISCYGGDISTPNIDRIANQGLLFSSFHTAPLCAPTRSMLMTGNDNHIAGMGIQGGGEGFGYEGHLTDRVYPLPRALSDAGYHTYMAGKWHLGSGEGEGPRAKGFERSFVLLGGAGNHFSGRSALEEGFSEYTEDDNPVSWPEGAYSTNYYTDRIIEYLKSGEGDGNPFFVYAAYTSPHWPLQVDTIHSNKFKGRYDEGYEVLLQNRMVSLKKKGIIPQNARVPELHPSVIAWDSLSEESKRKESRKMELYAGMVDNLDHNIGRLISQIEIMGEMDNTVFIFMSDNGADYRDFFYDPRFAVLQEYYNDDYEHMGTEKSYNSYGPGWAEAGSAPFRYFKDYATEGGTNTSMIIAGPAITRKGISHEFITVQDLAPTFLEWASAHYPDSLQGKAIYPMKGQSAVSYLRGSAPFVHDSTYVFPLEHMGYAMIRQGDWKITNTIKPPKRENFSLYNLSSDPAEESDLKEQYPEIFKALLIQWDRYVEEIQYEYPKSDKGD